MALDPVARRGPQRAAEPREVPRFVGTERPSPRPAAEPVPRGARLVALLGAGIGASGLLGWILDIPALRRILPGLPDMQPNTTLVLIAAGVALALPERLRSVALGLALFTLFIGVATAFEYAANVDLGLDNLFVQGTMRMAPQTTLAAAAIGLAVLLRLLPGRGALAQPLAAIPAVLSYLSVVGLLFDATVPLFPLATTMALNTGVAFLLIGFAVALSQPTRGLVARWTSTGPGGVTCRALLPSFVVLPPVLAYVRQVGERAGLWDEGFGIALQATTLMVLLVTGVLLHARSLDANEESRAGQAERFRHIVENIPEGVSVIDLCGRVLYANELLSTLLGRPATPGLSLTDCIEPGVQPHFHAFLRNAEHGATSATLTVRGEDAGRRFLRFSATPIPDPLSEVHGGTLLLVIDDTSRRVAEAGLRERALQLEQALRDLDEFATLASHDLREPLRKIQLLADRAAAEAARDDPNAADALHRIRRSASHLQERVAALLAYSRLAASARVVPNVDLGAVARAAEDHLHDRLRSAGATVVLGVLPTIDGDPALLRELFTCLFAHALETRRPGVPLVIQVASSPRSGGRVEIAVTDNGMGFDDQDATHMFEVFRSFGHRPPAGVGLATCRRILELHGGEIRARGKPGEGSVLTLSLPIRAQPGVPAECVPSDAP